MSSLARPCARNNRPCLDDVDRISYLPESVRSHILSFLPTKEAVATSFLSSRWKFLWKNVHNLYFSGPCSWSRVAAKEIKFSHFVNKVLMSLNQETLYKFSLSIHDYPELYDVNAWLDAAVARKVKVLDIHMSTSKLLIKLPCCVFTCKTLEGLVLYGVMVANVPDSVCFPNLRNLRLQSVGYDCNESVRNLISGCSSLETLYVQRAESDNVVTFSIYCPTLRRLTYRTDKFSGYTGKSFPEKLEYKLELNAPALRYLDLYDTLSKDFSVEKLCSLEKASIFTKAEKDLKGVPLIGFDRYSKAIVKLLQGVYNVKDLSLDGDILEAFSHAGVSLSFPRLTRLDVKGRCCKWQSLPNLMEASKELMYLKFSKDFDHCGRCGTSWSKPEKLPLWLSCLKTIQFQGLENELAFLGYILENAKVLKKMTVEAADYNDIQHKFWTLQKIAKIPRGSAECEVIYS